MNTLNPTNSFSLARFIHLCKRTFVLNQRQWIIGLLASIGIILVIWMVPTIFILSETGVNRFESLLPTALIIFTLWGLLLTSDIFQELYTPSTAFQSLTLPATSTEKFLSAWFLTMPVFLFLTIAAIFFISLLSSLILILFEGSFSGFDLYNPFNETTWDYALNYFFLNSLFLFGAVYFKKNNFLKTIAAFIALMISFILIWTLLGWVYLFLFELEQFTFQFSTLEPTNTVIDSILKWVIPTTALLFTYVSLKKQQVV
tara:strand:+ start:42779 stop:43552 length:774 start_codon:yes stop_codon:yes gene_type:complete